MEVGIQVKVVADSIRWDCLKEFVKGRYFDQPGRITTIVMTYPRWIHSEFMTHRDRARNAASSRAVSVKKSLENNKFRPKDIPSEQRGMQGGNELSPENKVAAYKFIEQLCTFTTQTCHSLVNLGVHKSVVNRYLEPFAYIEVVTTATRWDNFLVQRDHPAAEPHFQELAAMIRKELDNSCPVPREYHLPFVDDLEPEVGLRVSAARCAGISYQRPDLTVEKELEICNRLIHEKPPHSSPLEHPATCKDIPLTTRSGPMIGWKTLRTLSQRD